MKYIPKKMVSSTSSFNDDNSSAMRIIVPCAFRRPCTLVKSGRDNPIDPDDTIDWSKYKNYAHIMN